jgi:hypothetical protein
MHDFLLISALIAGLLGQAPLPQVSKEPSQPLEKSAYFAFVDRDYIFTIEVVKPGVPLFNFVSMVDKESNLLAKQVRITLATRKVPARFFLVDTGDPKEPVIAPSVRMRPRSSFGVRIQGDFGDEKELWGISVRIGEEDFRMVPLTAFDFENLVLKVNRLNLGSPDFSDDWRVLKLDYLGSRIPAPRR